MVLFKDYCTDSRFILKHFKLFLAMSLIEGIGDDVTAIFGVFLLGLVLALLWISTGVPDLPPIHVIILDPRRWRQLVRLLRASRGEARRENSDQQSDEDIGNQASTLIADTDTTQDSELSESVSHAEESSNQSENAPQSESNSGSSNDIQDNDGPTQVPRSSTDSDDIPEGHIRVRVKYLDERQKLLVASPETTIGEFKRVNFAQELSDNYAVRFIYQGRELVADDFSLRRYNISDNCVIHCILSQASSQQQEPTNRSPREPEVNIGHLMLPLFGIILTLTWYCRFAYRAYFTALSTLCLAAISFLYSLAVYASFRRPAAHEHVD